MNPLSKLVKNKRGSMTMVVVMIGTIAALVLGVYILASFVGAIPNITDTAANKTAQAVIDAGWAAFGLAVVIPIVVAASVILGYLIRGLGSGR